MKRLFPFLISLAVCLSVSGQFVVPPKTKSIKVDGYAARVNDQIITQGEVREVLEPVLQNLYRTYQGATLEDEIKKAYVTARDSLVERALIVEAFRARGGEIPDQYVNEEIKRMIHDRFKGDETLFEQMLVEQKKTRIEYTEILREQMAVGMMTNEEISRRVRITPAQVQAEYEAHRERYFIPEKVEHSVILLHKGTTEADHAVKRQEAESIRKRLTDGAEDFSTVAKELSEGSRAADGGKFPWMQSKDIRPELEKAIQSLPAGEISGIIETDTELYLVKIHARRQSAHKSFDEVRQSIETSLKTKERTRLKTRWISRLKENSYVVIYDS